MHCKLFLPLAFAASVSTATEADMKHALSIWDQQMTEYQAALDLAPSPEQKAKVLLPDTQEVAPKLWKAISAKVGVREVTERPKPAERRKGAKPTKRTVPTYEFEQDWALPGVIWFIQHPEAFNKLLEDAPRRQTFFADALLDSIERVHCISPAITPVCAPLSQTSDTKSRSILEAIYYRNPGPKVKAHAALALGILLGNPAISEADANPSGIRAKRIDYLKQALTLGPTEEKFGNASFMDTANELAYVLRSLTVGGVPPQLKVKDINGQEVQFPQTGKAHLLYFWAPVDDNAFDAVRHLEQAAKNYPHIEIRPITGKQEGDLWKETLREKGIDTCYMDDDQGTAASAYRLAQLPLAVLVNERCRIVYIGAPGLKLQSAIDSLNKQKQQVQNQQKTENKPHVIVEGQPAQAAPQPPVAAPTPAAQPQQDEAPALREMPEF